MSMVVRERRCSCRGTNMICQLCGGEGYYEVMGCRRCKGLGKMEGDVRCFDCRGTGEALVVDSSLVDVDDFVDLS